MTKFYFDENGVLRLGPHVVTPGTIGATFIGTKVSIYEIGGGKSFYSKEITDLYFKAEDGSFVACTGDEDFIRKSKDFFVNAPGAGGIQMTEVTHSELTELIGNGKLSKGALYRITDYVATTIQEDTHSAGHGFDIIVQALNESTLSEDAKAIKRNGDSYFEQCFLSAWEIKYTPYNDSERFTWADIDNGKGVIYYMKDEWGNECPYDFKSIQFKRYRITVCDEATLVGTYTGFSHNGELFPYGLNTEIDEDDFIFCYTFHGKYIATYPEDNWNEIEHLNIDLSKSNSKLYDVTSDERYLGCVNNVLLPANAFGGDGVIMKSQLNNVVVGGNYVIYPDNSDYQGYDYSPYNNKFGLNNRCISIGSTEVGACGNSFGDNCQYIVSSYGFKHNNLGSNCTYISFGPANEFNDIGSNVAWSKSGYYCTNNKIGNDVVFTFGTHCIGNVLGNSCNFILLGNECRDNSFGNGCISITIPDLSRNNTFGKLCSAIVFINGFDYKCKNNLIGDNCVNITLNNGAFNNIISTGCKNVSMGANNIVSGAVLFPQCEDITIQSGSNITIGQGSKNCSIQASFVSLGNLCEGITISSNSLTMGNRCKNISVSSGSGLRFGDACEGINLRGEGISIGQNCKFLKVDSPNNIYNVTVLPGVAGVSTFASDRLNLYDSSCGVSDGKPVTISKDSNGKFLMFWNENLLTIAGKYKNIATDAIWTQIT